ncbi:MAG: glycoside hydrolase family 3 protein [Hyphomonadaceae bacterium]|nr:glycoside hydrolase family 3 protein [Hyphomonadaceae bacterium]
MRKAWLGALMALVATLGAAYAQGVQPWNDPSRSPDERARLAEEAMTDEERVGMLHGPMALQLPNATTPLPSEAVPGAGYIAGVPRLGVPSLRETDASVGVTNPLNARPGDTATAFPAGLALGASFNPDLARRAGAIIGREARSKGFNVLLGPGLNLARDPRNGRNFEYVSEDPLLSGLIAGAVADGIQSEGVIATLKHYALNAQETNRHFFDAQIDPGALRESDLLAFQIAVERGRPGAIMCAYNLVNGAYACGNDALLNGVLKRDWKYPGWVMSDWGAVHDWRYALAGLDQQSGQQLDQQVWFDAPLKAALASGEFPRARLSDMVRRILRSMYAVGTPNTAAGGPIDQAAHHAVALEAARQGIVLLKNDANILPLARGAQRIAVIGGHADLGVLSGGGSAQVTPTGGYAASIPIGGEGMMAMFRRENYHPSAPIAEIRKLAPQATVRFDPGMHPADAAALARASDVAIVFVTRHELEGFDAPNLTLPNGQDALVAAVAAANPNTIVVIETGNPIAMPWLANVRGIVQAWYPGQGGAQALAEILFGMVNPSGRLPMTFPEPGRHPRPELPGHGSAPGERITVRYDEGSDVGYRWHAKHGVAPAFAFGQGLSYTSFAITDFSVRGGDAVTASFLVRNTGAREGAVTPQVYLVDAAGAPMQRLLGFERISLRPGQSRRVAIALDRRLLASFDAAANQWRIAGGAYRLTVSQSAATPILERTLQLNPAIFRD